MMKALKSKLAIGVIATGLVAGMGTAFAATDAGGQLQSWYNTATSATKALVAGDVAGFVAANKDKLVSDYKAINNGAVNDVKTAGTTETGRVQGSINGQVTAYSTAIDAKNTAIKNGMAGEYDNVVSGANFVNNVAVEIAGKVGEADIKHDVNAQGASSLSSLNSAVATTQNQAATTLTAKIEATKAELNALLAAERTAASQEIKDNIAKKVADKLAELQTLADALEAANKKSISEKGVSLETTGKAALENIVLDGFKK
ncbi:hypothetical protein GCM10008018_29020 [Paenibacillus marchantiophytorum]|uniref:Uncharacterized protein n=1 Tax=Paenibacillus marchantiophytorum TaxID=1619310 RepID=A0ABQ1EPN1_9BACL|nr:hypothetical protein [Paenibacillus marchantiophytorum]GFZ81482.1 hypothetical protein GCM10008018_29020 [Paenibacillus marchantiophytorum]